MLLHEIHQAIARNCLTFGNFQLSSGESSKYYVDLRCLTTYPELISQLADHIATRLEKQKFDTICGVPYGGIPIATLIAHKMKKPFLMLRKEAKKHGKGQLIEGQFRPNDRVVLVEDVVSTGGSLIDAIQKVKSQGIQVASVVVILDREMGGIQKLMEYGCTDITVITTISTLVTQHYYDPLTTNRHLVLDLYKDVVLAKQTKSYYLPMKAMDYYQYKHGTQPKGCLRQAILERILVKNSNLVLSLDETDSNKVSYLINRLGHQIAVLKLHSDMIKLSPEHVAEYGSVANFLTAIAQNEKQKYGFAILEDRKLADISKTCLGQIDLIRPWADMVTIHSFAVSKEVLEAGFGLVIIDSMSHDSWKVFHDKCYVETTYSLLKEMIKIGITDQNVVGFVTQYAILENSRYNKYLFMTPGVRLEVNKEADQNYRSVEDVVAGRTDMIIVGSHIWKADDSQKIAKEYQKRSWDAVFSIP